MCEGPSLRVVGYVANGAGLSCRGIGAAPAKRLPVASSDSMPTKEAGREGSGLAALTSALGLSVVAAYFLAPDESNVGFPDNATVLAFITAVAVGIERIIEFLWSLMGQSRFGGWWPLKQAREAFDEVEKETNRVLGSVIDNTKSALEVARDAADQGGDAAAQFSRQIQELERGKAKLNAQLDNAQKLAPGSARLALVRAVGLKGSAVVGRSASSLEAAAGDVRAVLEEVDEKSNMAIDIINGFADNPARRIASILIGSMLGVLVVGFIGLNVFAATLEDPGQFSGVLGIVLTGILVGLGASPTHEAIKALQNSKERNNLPQPVPTAAENGETRPLRLHGARTFNLTGRTDFIEAPASDQFVYVRSTD